ncbi:MGMT family protein [Pseudoxanthomonas koreensis]|uniref:MGMT family protein n=1 Tax=Pseudoxanthomonas koreensis TaxID=266061 RepID=UPI0013917959|nr:MGMT family protein [Pseudoxanthomonas koreensis]KAF1688803.1 methylated-DNA--protein-cysteine methyltransferase [Pseudoxanthomonas koreensis]
MAAASAREENDSARRILAAVRAIPPGQVAGYGEVARRAGLPGRARLAARGLAGDGDPALPWHRVLRADGRIAFPEGAPEWREQCRRLRAEGVHVERGRVKRDRSVEDLDAAVWGPPPRKSRSAG